MYQKSPKRLKGLHEMSVAYQESIPKPTKAKVLDGLNINTQLLKLHWKTMGTI